MAKPQNPPVVRFEIDTDDLPFQRFLEIASDFIAVLREVDRDVAPQAGVSWLIESISKSSPLALALRPVASNRNVGAALPRNLVRTVNSGIKRVQQRAERPAHFTDRALEKARALVEVATTGGAVVRIGTVKAPVRVDSKLVEHVDAILGATISSIGTVEGTLEAFNVHGRSRYFNVYDALTGERIRCDFGHRIPAHEIGAAAERRVAVHGEIKYRETGEIVNIVVHSFEVFPGEDDLPTADDVRGILRG